jgi:hypothetical protein
MHEEFRNRRRDRGGIRRIYPFFTSPMTLATLSSAALVTCVVSKRKRFRLSAVENFNPEIAEIAAEVRHVVQGSRAANVKAVQRRQNQHRRRRVEHVHGGGRALPGRASRHIGRSRRAARRPLQYRRGVGRGGPAGLPVASRSADAGGSARPCAGGARAALPGRGGGSALHRAARQQRAARAYRPLCAPPRQAPIRPRDSLWSSRCGVTNASNPKAKQTATMRWFFGPQPPPHRPSQVRPPPAAALRRHFRIISGLG